jgi:uncharacterized protein (TIGR02145 family)
MKEPMKNVICFILVSILVFTSCKKDSNPASPSEDATTVTYSGKVYHTVKIGSQIWLKENLDVGVMIQGTANPSNNGTIEKYCFDNDTANCNKYGGLYQWNEAMAYDTANSAKGICPDGWHIPTKAEFDTLATAVQYNGNSLKAVGQGTGGGTGTNSSRFSLLLTGYRDYYGSFGNLGYSAYFWSSTEYNSTEARNMSLWYDVSGINISGYYLEFGSSIRCMKD